MSHIIFVWTELIAPSGHGRKDSFLRRMRRTIGYTGRYLFPCPFSAGLSPLFSSALVTSFPSSPRTVISFFAPISPFRFYPATGVSSCFIASFLLSVIVSTAPLCLSSAHFCLTFSPPHRIPPACTIFAFPLFFSFPCPCHLFTAPPSPAVISPLLRSPPSAAFPPLPLSSCDTKNLIFV